MDDHLENASPHLRAYVETLGGESLIAPVGELVENNEEWICDWFDAQDEDGYSAHEVWGWSLVLAEDLQDGTHRIGLGIEVAVSPVDEDSDYGMHYTTLPAYVTVRTGPPPAAENLDLDAADADLRARAASQGVTVHLREIEQGIEVYGLPGPERPSEPSDVPESHSPTRSGSEPDDVLGPG